MTRSERVALFLRMSALKLRQLAERGPEIALDLRDLARDLEDEAAAHKLDADTE